MADFFISYTGADKAWAEWIAWELESAGYETILQAWDMRPGENFVLEMQRAASRAARTLVVLSKAFTESDFTAPEWAAAFAEDPAGQRQKLVPVRVEECTPPGMLRAIVYIDLATTTSPEDARTKLLAGVQLDRAKPSRAPAFPSGSSKPFPRSGAASALPASSSESDLVTALGQRLLRASGPHELERIRLELRRYLRRRPDSIEGEMLMDRVESALAHERPAPALAQEKCADGALRRAAGMRTLIVAVLATAAALVLSMATSAIWGIPFKFDSQAVRYEAWSEWKQWEQGPHVAYPIPIFKNESDGSVHLKMEVAVAVYSFLLYPYVEEAPVPKTVEPGVLTLVVASGDTVAVQIGGIQSVGSLKLRYAAELGASE